MADRLIAACLRMGMNPADARDLGLLFSNVISFRAPVMAGEEDVDYLHPARTALILMHDTGVADRATLGAGMALDSLYPDRTPHPEVLIEWGELGAAALLGELPGARVSREERIEALVIASENTRLAAIAERLDHARHLHLTPPESWAAFHDDVTRVYLPLAARTHAVLERRFSAWSERFAARYLFV
jgi:hypothetical protein